MAVKEDLTLYRQNDGSGVQSIYNWYLKNKSTDKVIRATIDYWRGGMARREAWTEPHNIEPGEEKNIGVHKDSGAQYTHAKIAGARYL